METKTQAYINKGIAERFSGWAKAINKPIDQCLYEAFNRLDTCDIQEELRTLNSIDSDKKKWFSINIDPEKWELFKVRFVRGRGYTKDQGLEIAMSVFIGYYDNKLQEVL